MMKIAVATSDGQTVAEHLARSLQFNVYEIQDKDVVLHQERLRESGECGHHRTFTELMDGCSAVLCGGVGQGAVNALAAAGCETIVLARPYRVDEALTAYLDGSLEKTDARVCLCGPGH